eukprot:TRINITY_DN9560_c0_g1_i1.p1 TRINITY_DN9560_c0_g1~~TRINITY_DN9560_c0_g1_i1.p1  ORF type:complete len:1932 (+),score=362.87 TRINITY_DN9560_c0_g1_i1:118-5913(+)
MAPTLFGSLDSSATPAVSSGSRTPRKASSLSPRKVQPDRTTSGPATARRVSETNATFGGYPAKDVALSRHISGAAIAHFKQKGFQYSAAEAWLEFFREELNNTGRIQFKDLEKAVQERLGLGDVTRYQLLVLWRRMDSDGSGEVSINELARLMYRLELATWPDAKSEELEHTVLRINSAAEKWFQASGNWYRIFLIIDPKRLGFITFEDLRRAVRSGSGQDGLRLSEAELSEAAIKKLWKAIDSEQIMRIVPEQFMAFMRRCASVSMHRLTEYAKMRRGNQDVPMSVQEAIKNAPELSSDELRDVAMQLGVLVIRWLANRGISGSSAVTAVTTPRVWSQLFNYIDTDGSGRITFPEMEACVRDMTKAVNSRTSAHQCGQERATPRPNLPTLNKLPVDSLRALWRVVDIDGSGEATFDEFTVSLYRLQIELWPKLDSKKLAQLVSMLNAAADKWHRASGNWYKVLTVCDQDGSGSLDFEEFTDVLRKNYPGLSISASDLNEDDLRGLWKAMDADQSGLVSVKEFMVFLRNHGKAHSIHRPTMYSLKMRGLLKAKKEIGPPPDRSLQDLLFIKSMLDMALLAYYSKHGLRCRVAEGWEMLFKEADADRSGHITLDKLAVAMRQRFLSAPGMEAEKEQGGASDGGSSAEETGNKLLAKSVTFEDFHALWSAVDQDGVGKLDAKEWWLGSYRLEWQSWPEPVMAEVHRVVEIIGSRGQKIHQSKNNWYRLFKLVDMDSSGNMDFSEFHDMVRNPMPCLSIRSKVVTEDQLKMVWKALDSDMSGLVDRGEFMVFMRRHQRVRDAKPVARDPMAEMAATRLILAEEFAQTGAEDLRAAFDSWGFEWTGQVTDWDWQLMVRRHLGIGEDRISDDVLHSVFAALDRENVGQMDADKLLERLAEQSMGTNSSVEAVKNLLRPDTGATDSTRPNTSMISTMSSTFTTTLPHGLSHSQSHTRSASIGLAAASEIEAEDSQRSPSIKPQTAPLSAVALGSETKDSILLKPHTAPYASTSSLQSGTCTGEQDPAFRMVADRLSEVMLAPFVQRGLQCSIAGGWQRFFEEMGRHHTHSVTFEELETMLQPYLQAARVSRYELLMIWRRIDADGLGEASLEEFVLLMYRFERQVWPDSSPEELGQIVKAMSDAAGKWMQASGNWHKVFQSVRTSIELESIGQIMFDDFRKFVRGMSPGLRMSQQEMPDDDICKLWKVLDNKMRIRVSKSEFMATMRRYVAGVQRPPGSSRKKRAQAETPRLASNEFVAVSQYSKEALRSVALRLASLLHRWLSKRGFRCASVSSPTVWSELFTSIDADGSGRLTYKEFEEAVLITLQGAARVSIDEIRALWRLVDVDASGHVTPSEFATELYRLQLTGWPRLLEHDFSRLVGILNAAADKWHRASGNWYKVLNVCDEDRSGRLEFEEFTNVVRKSFPGLSISQTEISDDDLRGLWRAMDDDESGWVSIKEFMVWMRQHGKAYSMHKLTSYSMQKRGMLPSDMSFREGLVPTRSRGELVQIKRLLEQALMTYLSKKGIRTRIREAWNALFKDADVDKSGRLCLDEIEQFMRAKLLRNKTRSSSKASLAHSQDAASLAASDAEFFSNGPGCLEHDDLIVHGVTHDDMRALWHQVDGDKSGEVSANEWNLALYHMELETWASSDEDTLLIARAVDGINNAATLYYQAQNNWYRIFCLVDRDGSGKMDFDSFKEMVRRPLPCLSVPTTSVSDRELKALWKQMDADQSAEITLQEFMVFMRRHSQQKVLLPEEEPPKADPMAELEEARKLVADGLALHTLESIGRAYKSWGFPWTGDVSEWEFQLIVRQLVGIDESRMDDRILHAIWASLDTEIAGRLDADDMLCMLRTGRRQAVPRASAPKLETSLPDPSLGSPIASTATIVTPRVKQRKELLKEITYWRSAWWTSHLRPGGKTQTIQLPKVAPPKYTGR